MLTVTNVSHGFGERQILDNATFRMKKGEHIGLVGANGEGKTTFLNIITGKEPADEGTIVWAKRATVGYLDQHSVLEKGQTIRDVLRKTFDDMYQMESDMLEMYNKMGDCTDEEMTQLMEDVGDIQDILDHSGFYTIDSRIEEYANGLGLGEIGLDRDVSELSGGQRTKVLLTKLLLQNPTILILDEPTNHLDVDAKDSLKKAVKDFKGTVILVSHEPEFYSDIVTDIWNLEDWTTKIV